MRRSIGAASSVHERPMPQHLIQCQRLGLRRIGNPAVYGIGMPVVALSIRHPPCGLHGDIAKHAMGQLRHGLRRAGILDEPERDERLLARAG